MEPNTAPKWIACGNSMKISENERVITKTSTECKFGVALSERLTDTLYEIDVTFQGDCYYFAIGLAKSTIPLNDSLRRLNAGSAWFILNKGFLCDGKTFPDDSLDPFGVGEKIKVTFDRERGRLMFLRNEISVGIVDGLAGEDLRFCCYMDGSNASCSIAYDEPVKELPPTITAIPSAPATKENDNNNYPEPTPPPRQPVSPKKSRQRTQSSEEAPPPPPPPPPTPQPPPTPSMPEHSAPIKPPIQDPPPEPPNPSSTGEVFGLGEMFAMTDTPPSAVDDTLQRPPSVPSQPDAFGGLGRPPSVPSPPLQPEPAAAAPAAVSHLVARYQDMQTRTPLDPGAASDPPPVRARDSGVAGELPREELFSPGSPAMFSRQESLPVTTDEHAVVDKHHFVVEQYKARQASRRSPSPHRPGETPPQPAGRAPYGAGAGPAQPPDPAPQHGPQGALRPTPSPPEAADMAASDPAPLRARDSAAAEELQRDELFSPGAPAMFTRQESLPVTTGEKDVVDQHHFVVEQYKARQRKQRDQEQDSKLKLQQEQAQQHLERELQHRERERELQQQQQREQEQQQQQQQQRERELQQQQQREREQQQQQQQQREREREREQQAWGMETSPPLQHGAAAAEGGGGERGRSSRGRSGGEEALARAAQQSREWVEKTRQEVHGQREEVGGRGADSLTPGLTASLGYLSNGVGGGQDGEGRREGGRERAREECRRCGELDGVRQLVELMVDAARDRGAVPWRELTRATEGKVGRELAGGLKEVWEHLAWLEGEHRRTMEERERRAAAGAMNGHADGADKGRKSKESKAEVERLTEELSDSERERLSLMAELSRMTSRMGAMEASIISLQRQCFHKDEALRALNELDPDPDENIWANAGQELARMEASVRYLSESRATAYRGKESGTPSADSFSTFGLLDIRGSSPQKSPPPPRARQSPPQATARSRASPGPGERLRDSGGEQERPRARSRDLQPARPSMAVRHPSPKPAQEVSPPMGRPDARSRSPMPSKAAAMDAGTAFMSVDISSRSMNMDGSGDLSSSKVSYASLC